MRDLVRYLSISWTTAGMALGVGIASLIVAWAMLNGWNPYDLAPFLQRAQAGISCLGGLLFAGIGVYGVVHMIRLRSPNGISGS